MKVAFPHPPGKGGPGSFQTRFEAALRQQGHEVLYPASASRPDIIVVVGGTKRLHWLWKMKRAGVPILYRLDGINWLHRKTRFSLRDFVYGESRNWLNQFIHAYLADYVVYQSHFAEKWWNDAGWRRPRQYTVISNGVDLAMFSPSSGTARPKALLCLEGTVDYSPYAVELLNQLALRLQGGLPVIVYGGFQQAGSKQRLSPAIDYRGKVARADLPSVYREAIYLSLDVNAACPNTVIEALASGIPVVGFDTGALRELVPAEAGAVVPYGSDPWQLKFPDIDGLADAIADIISDWSRFALNARKTAESRHDMAVILDRYLQVMERCIKKNHAPEKSPVLY